MPDNTEDRNANEPNLDPMPTNAHANEPIGPVADTRSAPGQVQLTTSSGEEAASRPLTEEEKTKAEKANQPPETDNPNGQSEPPQPPNSEPPPTRSAPIIPPKPGEQPVE